MSETSAVLLVVDDEDAGRFVKVQTLRRAGYTVYEAATGADGLRQVESRSPDVVVLDVNLPDVSGLEVCRRIRQHALAPPAIQVLQVSSTAVDAKDRVAGLDHGADVYLTEPLEPGVLVATVRALLRVRRAEKALAEALEGERIARRHAEEATRLRDEFIATLSHELRTPLNAVMGWLWQLRHSSLDAAAQARALDSLERNARLQVQLIGDLLDVSRIAKGKLLLELSRVDVLAVVNDALDSVSAQAEQKELTVQVTGRSATVIADAGRLQQIVTNLLTNAIQFTPPKGSIAVTLTADGDESVLRITDTGLGISAELLPSVFDQFRQGAGGLMRKHCGLGLGLAVVRQLIDLHGGAVQVESRGPGQGSTFILRIPREPDSAQPPLDRAPVLRGMRVAIVSQEAEYAELLKSALEASGADVRVIARDDAGQRAGADLVLTEGAAGETTITGAGEPQREPSPPSLPIDVTMRAADVVRSIARYVLARPDAGTSTASGVPASGTKG